MSEKKIFITHGIFWFRTTRDARNYEKPYIYCRNTTKYFPLPLKFRDLLEEKYLQWWHVETSIFRFGKRIPIETYVDIDLEFTIAHEPETDTWVISIVHPLDVFKRKTGVKIVRERMEFALEYPNNNKRWSYRLE